MEVKMIFVTQFFKPSEATCKNNFHVRRMPAFRDFCSEQVLFYKQHTFLSSHKCTYHRQHTIFAKDIDQSNEGVVLCSLFNEGVEP
jgi:hypothetical protein